MTTIDVFACKYEFDIKNSKKKNHPLLWYLILIKLPLNQTSPECNSALRVFRPKPLEVCLKSFYTRVLQGKWRLYAVHRGKRAKIVNVKTGMKEGFISSWKYFRNNSDTPLQGTEMLNFLPICSSFG